MDRSKKILFINEASHIASGFGTYGNEVLGRLHEWGYKVAEFATGTTLQSLKKNPRPWPRYANNVRHDDPRYNEFKSKPTNKYGEWRFERVLLDYRPDCCFTIQDPWGFLYQCTSPFRRFFHHAIMPTVDSAPQRDEWIDSFMTADSVLTYTDWGQKVLYEQSNGKMNLMGTASPGVDLSIFKPVADKKEHKRALGFSDDAVIIGMVGRNQVRKLYPDLFLAFRRFIDKYPELSEKVYLYCHTAYPDVGWDIPYWLNYYGVGQKVLFSYLCDQTNRPFVAKFQGGRTYSPYSNAPTGLMPSTNQGFTREQLAQVYQLMDFYVQLATNEGFGMVLPEATACGVPVAATNYSGMENILNKTKGFPIPVERYFHDLGTQSIRAYPDINYTADLFARFAEMSDIEWQKRSKKARKGTEAHFDWDQTAKTWANHFDSIVLTGEQGMWNSTPRFFNVPTSIPKGLNNKQFVDWLYLKVIDEPKRRHGTEALALLQDLNFGWTRNGDKLKRLTQEEVFKLYLDVANNKLICEENRCGIAKPKPSDYIDYAREFMT